MVARAMCYDRRMRFYVGTSGYSYPKWKGSFYPAKLPQKEMLSSYAERFTAVEINNSFYRMPATDVLKSWAKQVPASFQFAFKAPQTITHFKRLKDANEPTKQFLKAVGVMKSRRGPLLFGLPPNFKKDLPRLQRFLKLLRGQRRVACEFRHASWFDEETFDCLRDHRCALCTADEDKLPFTDLVSTTDWGYVRLRRENYTDKDLRAWVKRIRSQPWQEVYVFFKHEDTGTGPKFAARFLEQAEHE
jgi:uncharacterized protein YecE (DUF72 family)